MAKNTVYFTTPVGRYVGGSLYEANTTDHMGNPRVIQNGPNKGQAKSSFDFAIAIPKIPGQHWATYPRHIADKPSFGEAIWGVGTSAFPQTYQRDDFAWKITDGDSTKLNKANKRPCDQEGYPGHWVLWFSTANPPRIWNRDASERLTAEKAIKCGDYIQVMGSVLSNEQQTNPGVYLNHSDVALSGYGAEISRGPDGRAAGFGQAAALPPGASTTPTAGLGGAPTPPAPGAAAAPPAAPAQTPVAPNPAFVTNTGAAMPPPPPGATATPPVPPAAVPVPPARQMTELAAGATYESFIEKGWTDALLKQHGYML